MEASYLCFRPQEFGTAIVSTRAIKQATHSNWCRLLSFVYIQFSNYLFLRPSVYSSARSQTIAEQSQRPRPSEARYKPHKQLDQFVFTVLWLLIIRKIINPISIQLNRWTDIPPILWGLIEIIFQLRCIKLDRGDGSIWT